jgi:secreted PhoX family phosphatase
MKRFWSRRAFLKFLGISGACVTSPVLRASQKGSAAGPKGLLPSTADRLVLLDGVDHYLIAKSGDPIDESGQTFGVNNDFIAYLPAKSGRSEDRGSLIVNHEFPDPVTSSGGRTPDQKTKDDVDRERASVGCSILGMARDKRSGKWAFLANASENQRWDASSNIAFDREVLGFTRAEGTFANCSGGVTPWRTFLTCEENYEDYYGASSDDQRQNKAKSKYGWLRYYQRPPEHYGWVVEVDPASGSATKLTGLGRFAHEGALVVSSKQAKCVVYMGDDNENECLYKFISDQSDSLRSGTLYVANLDAKRWIPLSIESSPALKARFKSQTDLLVHTREAARLVGGTRLDRPEGIARHPKTGQVLVSLTNNIDRVPSNYFGSLLSIDEKNGDPGALEFSHGTFLAGGESGVACPDNIVFGENGGLWLTTDISGKVINQGPYKPFGNNALFYIPTTGPNAGQPIKIASAPVEAEFTGPCIMPDGETILVSVQHPGEMTKSLSKPTSRWPEGGKSLPRSAVIALTGPKIRELLSLV